MKPVQGGRSLVATEPVGRLVSSNLGGAFSQRVPCVHCPVVMNLCPVAVVVTGSCQLLLTSCSRFGTTWYEHEAMSQCASQAYIPKLGPRCLPPTLKPPPPHTHTPSSSVHAPVTLVTRAPCRCCGYRRRETLAEGGASSCALHSVRCTGDAPRKQVDSEGRRGSLVVPRSAPLHPQTPHPPQSHHWIPMTTPCAESSSVWGFFVYSHMHAH